MNRLGEIGIHFWTPNWGKSLFLLAYNSYSICVDSLSWFLVGPWLGIDLGNVSTEVHVLALKLADIRTLLLYRPTIFENDLPPLHSPIYKYV